MHLSPDNVVFWQHGFLKINATIAITWALMFVLTVGFVFDYSKPFHRLGNLALAKLA